MSYDVLFDRETKTYVPISAIRKYAYENEINLIDRYKHGYAVRNEDLRECLANPEYRTVRQINKAMRESLAVGAYAQRGSGQAKL